MVVTPCHLVDAACEMATPDTVCPIYSPIPLRSQVTGRTGGVPNVPLGAAPHATPSIALYSAAPARSGTDCGRRDCHFSHDWRHHARVPALPLPPPRLFTPPPPTVLAPAGSLVLVLRCGWFTFQPALRHYSAFGRLGWDVRVKRLINPTKRWRFKSPTSVYRPISGPPHSAATHSRLVLWTGLLYFLPVPGPVWYHPTTRTVITLDCRPLFTFSPRRGT